MTIDPTQGGATAANVLWFLPTHGDGRYLGTSDGARHISHRYLSQVARAADELGYFGVLLPTGKSCEDSWVIASSMVPLTERLRFLVAVRPGLQSPTVAARMTATLDRISNGRLLINVVTGGDPVENAGDGLFHNHDDRYVLTEEFLDVYTRLLAGEEVSFAGEQVRIEKGQLIYPVVQDPHPPLYFGGSSEAGKAIGARFTQKYLTWGEPPGDVAEKVIDVRNRARAIGREISFGIRLHVIVRETERAAWAAAEELISHIDDEAIAASQKKFAAMDSVGQARMSALHGGRRDRLEVSPNLWAGVGLVRGGAGTALVGDPDTVAARIKEYMAIGIDTFIMSGYPHLEEAYRFAELVLPLLPLAETTLAPRGATSHRGPFGEVMGNSIVPKPSRLAS